MIITELYNGQGLGNQLWSYVVTRCIALDKGYEFGIMCPERFKGADFMNLDFGREVSGGYGPEGGPPEKLPDDIYFYYKEKDIFYEKFKCDVSDFDPGLYNVLDNTKIDGTFQCERYIKKYKNEIQQWLKVNDEFNILDFSDSNICVLNIRGGEYVGNKSLCLPKKYWNDAISNMKKINPQLQFIIITDDIKYTKKLLPQYPSYHFCIGKDYSVIKNAHYLILSNSSFAFFPAWLNQNAKFIIAPKYWARHNISNGFWSCTFNLYEDWHWQDRDGKLYSYSQCERELISYNTLNKLYLFPSRPIKKEQHIFFKNLKYLIDLIAKFKRDIKNNF